MSALSLKIDVSGVRGIAGDSLSPQLVTSFAAAFGTYAGKGPIVIGSDTRPSREMVTEATVAGLLSVGCSPVDLGIVPTPTLQSYIRSHRTQGGIAITASHNPEDWNALKFFARDGILLRANQFRELVDLYHQGVYPRVKADEITEVSGADSAINEHQDSVLERIDVDAIRGRQLRVVVDGCNGAASVAMPTFLRKLGCEVHELHCSLVGSFPRNPVPAPEHTTALAELVKSTKADLGLALDADADRVAFVAQDGTPLGEGFTLALAVRRWMEKQPGPIVVDSSTSQALEDIAYQYNVELIRCKVGEVNVIETMLKSGATIGGEGNGGVIVAPINPCRDSFVATALILDALGAERTGLKQLSENVPTYKLVKRDIPCRPRKVALALRRLRRVFAGEQVDTSDGVRVKFADGAWISVRGANTEPVIRVVAEAKRAERAQALAVRAIEYVRPIVQ